MNTKELKKVFSQVAENTGFKAAFGGWFRESDECIVTLGLQRSNFGNYYELNIKIFVQGLFGKVHVVGDDLIKRSPGTVFRRQPKDYDDGLMLDSPMEDQHRKERIESLFREFIGPFTATALTRNGLRELAQRADVYLLPAVKEELAKPA